MNEQIFIAACVCVVSAAIIMAAVDAVITVWASRYSRPERFAMALRWLGWRWNSLQWRLANIRFDISVRFNNWKAGF